MAASVGLWRKVLNNHPIFEVLRGNQEEFDHVKDSKRLLAVKDGEIFVWNSSNASVLTGNLKSLVQNTDNIAHQILLSNRPPLFDVESIEFSNSGALLALIGPRGVSVIELPQRWGKFAEFEGGKKRITCKTVCIDEHFFACNNKIQILHASWHPGSDTGTHLVILTSDNVLRIYNVLEADSPEQTFPLGDPTGNSLRSSALSLPIAAALGDQAMAFDFGPPVELDAKVFGLKSSEAVNSPAPLGWPIYILWGNGDVYSLVTTVAPQRLLRSKVQGPLSMYPPAEDNYGSDACSILCLQSRPPVLAIATPAGKLYHCIVLNKELDDNMSEVSYRDADTDKLPEFSLYLYESIELELSLTTVTVDTDELVTDDFTCPIRLHADPGSQDRYHCSHNAGVHSVVIPWLHRFQQYCDEGTDPAALDQLNQAEEATVEHLICTKPLPSSPAAPMLGLSITADRLLGPTLIALTSSLDVITLPLLLTYHGSPPPLLSASPGKRSAESPLRRLHKDAFDTHIQKILQKSSSNPILKTHIGTELTPQECFQLLSRATQVFREEYIQKMDLARQEIEKRLRILKEQKEAQQSDLKDCNEVKNKLTDKAQELAERYEETRDKQTQIIDRIETVLKKLQARLPQLSEAERNMHKELKDISESLAMHKNHIQQLKTKEEYHKRQIGPKAQGGSTSSPANLSKNQTQYLRTVLQNEGDQISDLVKQVNSLKIQLHT